MERSVIPMVKWPICATWAV